MPDGSSGGDGQVVVLNPYAIASRELERFFGVEPDRGSLDAELGFRAQRYDVGGRGVFDSIGGPEDFYNETRHLSASGRLHNSLLTPKHRKDIRDHTRIKRTLYGLPIEDRYILRTAFSPRRWSALETLPDDDEKEQKGRWVQERDRAKHKGKGIPHAERQLRIVLSMRRAEARGADRTRIANEAVPAATLIDLAIASGVAFRAHADKLKPTEPPSAHGLLLWMLNLADDSRRSDIPHQRSSEAMGTLSKIREATGDVLMPSLKVYDEARRERREREIAEEAERPKRLMTEWQAGGESRRLRRIVDHFQPEGWSAIKQALGVVE